jgi:outer membrane protein OmpA-like peptidoglycan-associated protein
MGSPSTTLRVSVLNLAAMLLAGVLVGCSTKATHLGSLSGDPSMATPDNSTRRITAPAGAQTARSTTDGSSAPEGAAGDRTTTSGSSNASEAAGAEGMGASSSGDATGGTAKASRKAGGATSTTASGTDGAASAGGPGAAAAGAEGAGGDTTSSLANGAVGSAQDGAPGVNGAQAGGGASSRAGGSAKAGGGRAGPRDSSEGDATGADLSSEGSEAAVEGGADGVSAGQRARAAGSSSQAAGASEAGIGAGGATAADVEGDSRIAAIDVPSGKVKVDEEYRPQTLGGALPLILGVNEEGRFDFDQYSLRPEVKQILDELAAKLKTAEYDRLDIVGYTDRIGSVDYNRRLSELRAYAVAQYLMGKGVPENKIRYEGRGEKNPLTPSSDCQGLAREDLITCLQKDRRVEIEASIHRKHATVIQ